jgi:hypothetical protein
MNACRTSGAMREASPQTNTIASCCNSGHTSSPWPAIACCRLAGFAREGADQPRHARRLEPAHLLLVEEVLQRVRAAEEQQRRADRRPLLLQRRVLLQEAAKGRDAGPRAHHDHRRVRVLRRMKRNGRLADEAVERRVGRLSRQVGPVTARLCDMATLLLRPLLSPLAQIPGLPYRFGCRLRATGCSNGCPR